MTEKDYSEIVKSLRVCAASVQDYECDGCLYRDVGDCTDNLKRDAAAAIEELQAEAQRQKDGAVHYQILYEQWKESYEREKTRADMYEELFDIFRKSRNEIIEQIGRVKGVPDFALHYPESNLCANYPEKQDCSENPNG